GRWRSCRRPAARRSRRWSMCRMRSGAGAGGCWASRALSWRRCSSGEGLCYFVRGFAPRRKERKGVFFALFASWRETTHSKSFLSLLFRIDHLDPLIPLLREHGPRRVVLVREADDLTVRRHLIAGVGIKEALIGVPFDLDGPVEDPPVRGDAGEDDLLLPGV